MTTAVHTASPPNALSIAIVTLHSTHSSTLTTVLACFFTNETHFQQPKVFIGQPAQAFSLS